MLWTKALFGVEKPVIAMLHLDPLPGDPAWRRGDSLEAVVRHARQDLLALQSGGVDAILVSNEFSLPYQRHMSFVTPAAMARVIGELKPDLALPLGVDCISDGLATLELAAAVDASFVRGTFSGVYVGDGGLYHNDISDLLRRKAALGLEGLRMLYFLNPESDRNLDTRPLDQIARSLLFKAAPDGLCVSASAAGEDVSTHEMDLVWAAARGQAAVFCNTGCRVDTVAGKLAHCDGAVVGSTFKRDGVLRNHVDVQRVAAFMEVVRAVRAGAEE